MLKTTHPIEETIGIRYYITDTPGLGGKLRSDIEDFVVREIPFEKIEDPNGDYTHFTLEKYNWDTIRAIGALSRALGVSRKRIGFAGTKDKRALTYQRMAVWKIDKEQLEKIRVKDLALSDFMRSSERLSVGELKGNEFELRLREPRITHEDLIHNCLEELNERGVPNYFGYQRFGVIRPNTHIVGRKIIEGDIEGAVMSYLADYYPLERDDARDARKDLKETLDFKKALETFPRRLGFERTMIEHLHIKPNDYAGALRRLHKKLRQILVHGYQSYIYNLVLSRIIEEEIPIKGLRLPVIGYKSTLSDGRIGEIEQAVLESEGHSQKDFRIASMPELSSRGSYRDASIGTKVEHEPSKYKDGSIIFRFTLPPGNYATMVMREIMKADPMNY